MTLERRKFIRTTLVGSTIMAVGVYFSIANAKGKENGVLNGIKLKISFQEGNAPGADLNEKFDFMEAHTIVGFELHGKFLYASKQEMKDEMKGRNIKVSSVCAGFDGFILSNDPTIRKLCRDIMDQLIICEQFDEMGTFARQYGTTVIFETSEQRGSFLPAPSGRNGIHLSIYQKTGCYLFGGFLAYDLGGNVTLWCFYLSRQLPTTFAYR